MKKIFLNFAIILVCCACSKQEKLLVGGIGWSKIAIIDKASRDMEWVHTLAPDEECIDVDITAKGEILYAYKQGAKLIKRDGTVVWDYKAGENEEIHTASVIESGNYLLGICGIPARIVELNKNGEPVKEVPFNTATPEIDRQFSQILKTPQNTYLVPLTYKRKISEIGEDGRFIKSVLCGCSPNSVKLANNGYWVVSCGEGQSFLEINPVTKKIVRTVTTDMLNWGSLLYVSELIRYKNGNTLIANSNMNNDDKSQPLLFEIDSSGYIAWRMPYNPNIGNITTVQSFYK